MGHSSTDHSDDPILTRRDDHEASVDRSGFEQGSRRLDGVQAGAGSDDPQVGERGGADGALQRTFGGGEGLGQEHGEGGVCCNRSGSLTRAATDVLAERSRQVNAEGWLVEHDDNHTDGSLALAAACYAAGDAIRSKSVVAIVDVSLRGECPVWGKRKFRVPALWPESWAHWWWKPKDRRADLVRAGALILAEIERLDRRAKIKWKDRVVSTEHPADAAAAVAQGVARYVGGDA